MRVGVFLPTPLRTNSKMRPEELQSLQNLLHRKNSCKKKGNVAGQGTVVDLDESASTHYNQQAGETSRYFFRRKPVSLAAVIGFGTANIKILDKAFSTADMLTHVAMFP